MTDRATILRVSQRVAVDHPEVRLIENPATREKAMRPQRRIEMREARDSFN